MNNIDESYQYLIEQFEIENFGRVVSTADDILLSGRNELFKHTLELKFKALVNQMLDNDAIECLKEALKLFPDDYEFRINKAIIHLEIGAFIEAKQDLEILLKNHPNKSELILNLIYVEEALNNNHRVIELCNFIISNHPPNFYIYCSRGNAHENLNNYQEAINDYEFALKQENNDILAKSDVYNNIGYVYTKLKNYNKANEYLEYAIELDGNNAFAFNNLGLVWAHLGNVEKDLELVNLSIKMDPDNSYAYKNKAKIYIMQKHFSRAKINLERAKKLNYELDYGDEVNQLLRQLNAY